MKICIIILDYNFALPKVKINLGSLTKELKLPSFVILMSLGVSKGRLQLKGARQPPQCILNSFNKILEVLIKMNFLILFHLIKRLTIKLKWCQGRLHRLRHLMS
jgi:hypothetical protein